MYKKHDISKTSKHRKATTLQDKETPVDSQTNIIPDPIETPSILATTQPQNIIEVTSTAHTRRRIKATHHTYIFRRTGKRNWIYKTKTYVFWLRFSYHLD